MKKYKLDSEEQAIIDVIEQGEYNSLKDADPEAFEKAKQELQQVATNTLERLTRKKSYTMKLIEHDVEQIKVMALERGLPYQTFIASVLHRVASGQVPV
jgi:predicted DNA binding CopG/RHH family protein